MIGRERQRDLKAWAARWFAVDETLARQGRAQSCRPERQDQSQDPSLSDLRTCRIRRADQAVGQAPSRLFGAAVAHRDGAECPPGRPASLRHRGRPRPGGKRDRQEEHRPNGEPPAGQMATIFCRPGCDDRPHRRKGGSGRRQERRVLPLDDGDRPAIDDRGRGCPPARAAAADAPSPLCRSSRRRSALSTSIRASSRKSSSKCRRSPFPPTW